MLLPVLTVFCERSINPFTEHVKAIFVYLSKQMSIESAIEQKIKEAIARGEFDGLSGAGKPLDLTDYFATPEDVRMGYSILKSNNFVPEEVELMKEIAGLREKLRISTAAEERKALEKQISDNMLSLSLILEKNKRRS